MKEFYKTKFNFEPNLVELVVNLDIIIMCSRGASNNSISKFLKLQDYDFSVYDILDKYLGFGGWKEDLPFNPKRIYDGLDTKDNESFVNIVVVQYGFTDRDIIDKAYSVALLATRLEKLTDEKWI